MGAEFIVNTLEEMCDLMCGGIESERYKPKKDSRGRKIVSVNLKVKNIYKHESDFSDIDDGVEEIEDS